MRRSAYTVGSKAGIGSSPGGACWRPWNIVAARPPYTNVRSFGKRGTGYCDVVVEVGLGIFSGEWHKGTGLDHGATLANRSPRSSTPNRSDSTTCG